jgi:hypothetical protein
MVNQTNTNENQTILHWYDETMKKHKKNKIIGIKKITVVIPDKKNKKWHISHKRRRKI